MSETLAPRSKLTALAILHRKVARFGKLPLSKVPSLAKCYEAALTKRFRAGGCAGVNYPFLTQKEWDIETGLDYFGARYYTNVQGRFTSVEPSQKSISLVNPQSWNRYSYTYNNPLAFVDKNGKWPTWIHNLIIDRALPGLSQNERQDIKDGSWFVDDPAQGGQHTSNSNNHGMTKPGQSQEEAAEKADTFINNHVDAAQVYSKRGWVHTSLFKFGMAYHSSLIG